MRRVSHDGRGQPIDIDPTALTKPPPQLQA
jgi:hypothetical protein